MRTTFPELDCGCKVERMPGWDNHPAIVLCLLHASARSLGTALKNLTEACLSADAKGDLNDEVDGAVLDAASRALRMAGIDGAEPPDSMDRLLDEARVLAERVAYHFENQPHPIDDEARALLKKVRGE